MAPVAVKVALFPEQIEVGEAVAEIVGDVFTVIEIVSVSVQFPFAPINV